MRTSFPFRALESLSLYPTRSPQRQTCSQAVTLGVKQYPFYPLFRDVHSTHQLTGTQLILHVIRQSYKWGHLVVTGVNVRYWLTFLPWPS